MKSPIDRTPCIRMVVFLLCVSLLNGCALISTALKDKTGSAPVPVLDYYQWVGTLPDSAVEQERERLQKLQTGDPVIHQVQLAILFSSPQNPAYDQDALAITELDRAIKSFEKSPDQIKNSYQQFALIWKEILLQRQLLGRNLENKDIVLDDLRNQVQNLQARNKTLLKQINALKSIEQQINEREIFQERP